MGRGDANQQNPLYAARRNTVDTDVITGAEIGPRTRAKLDSLARQIREGKVQDACWLLNRYNHLCLDWPPALDELLGRLSQQAAVQQIEFAKGKCQHSYPEEAVQFELRAQAEQARNALQDLLESRLELMSMDIGRQEPSEAVLSAPDPGPLAWWRAENAVEEPWYGTGASRAVELLNMWDGSPAPALELVREHVLENGRSSVQTERSDRTGWQPSSVPPLLSALGFRAERDPVLTRSSSQGLGNNPIHILVESESEKRTRCGRARRDSWYQLEVGQGYEIQNGLRNYPALCTQCVAADPDFKADPPEFPVLTHDQQSEVRSRAERRLAEGLGQGMGMAAYATSSGQPADAFTELWRAAELEVALEQASEALQRLPAQELLRHLLAPEPGSVFDQFDGIEHCPVLPHAQIMKRLAEFDEQDYGAAMRERLINDLLDESERIED